MTIRLRGWAAVLLILTVGGFFAFRTLVAHAELPGEAADALRLHLAGVYASKTLDDESSNLAEKAARLLDLRDIEFVSIRGRGTPDDMIVRAEIRVGGKTPPDGREVRYFRMERSSLTGWHHRGDATALSYYLRAF